MKKAMTFAEKLRSERQRLGLSQVELAGVLGVSFEAVSKWERGLTTPAQIAQEGALARLRALSSSDEDVFPPTEDEILD